MKRKLSDYIENLEALEIGTGKKVYTSILFILLKRLLERLIKGRKQESLQLCMYVVQLSYCRFGYKIQGHCMVILPPFVVI